MNYAGIHKCDTADGEGIRVGLYVSGCTRHCFNCHNVAAQDFNYGKPFTEIEAEEVLKYCSPKYVEGLSLLGGEPLHPLNSKELVKLVRSFRERFGESKTLWVYTGCVMEELYDPASPYYSKATIDLLTMTDVLVDGPYEESLRDPSLSYRGSSNQRIIKLK